MTKAIFKKGSKNNYYGYTKGGNRTYIRDLKLDRGLRYVRNLGKWIRYYKEVSIVNSL